MLTLLQQEGMPVLDPQTLCLAHKHGHSELYDYGAHRCSQY
jgi:hypothetical protein